MSKDDKAIFYHKPQTFQWTPADGVFSFGENRKEQNMIRYYSVPKETFVTNGTIVEPLNVTENGTYAPPAGTAYSPVVVNVEGGGSSWQTVFEGSVTTTEDDGIWGTIEGVTSLADTIKVTFNGTEYECEKDTDGFYGAPYDGELGDFDWSEYPFSITVSDGTTILNTESTGTYTLKIEEEQSGSSDFSTAEISISAAVPGVQCSVVSPHIITTPFDMLVADPKNYSNGDIVTVALYKGKASISASVVGMGNITVSGDIESMGGNYYLITGDCAITIS